MNKSLHIKTIRHVSSCWTRDFSSNVRFEMVKPNIGCISLINEKSKNSFSSSMLNDFNLTISEASKDKTIRALIFKSEVNGVFCAGANLKERLAMKDDEVGPFVEKLRNCFFSISQLPMPTIAAIEGAALGGGLELSLACDLRIAGENAMLGLPETSIGIIPGAGGTQRLSRLIGISKAKYLTFTGRRLTAKEAFEFSIVNESVEVGKSFDKAFEIAEKICKNAPIAVRMAKQAINEGYPLTLSEGMKVEKECYGEVIYTKDRLEGLHAFVEKRKPIYKGE